MNTYIDIRYGIVLNFMIALSQMGKLKRTKMFCQSICLKTIKA
jgi:hypothetical protein